MSLMKQNAALWCYDEFCDIFRIYVRNKYSGCSLEPSHEAVLGKTFDQCFPQDKKNKQKIIYNSAVQFNSKRRVE